MQKYRQPDFYCFNEDSINLVNYICENFIKKDNIDVLDLCCGSGVIGIEFYLKYSHKIKGLYFVEIQEEFEKIIEENVKTFIKGPIDFNIIIQDFKTIQIKKKFDLILCNPPYFYLDETRKSSNKNRSLCKFWQKSDQIQMINFIRGHLKTNSRGFFLSKNNIDHLESVKQVKSFSNVDLYAVTSL